jgi:hypothetical protein
MQATNDNPKATSTNAKATTTAIQSISTTLPKKTNIDEYGSKSKEGIRI